MKYKTLSHPAELRLQIYGKTIEELFENAAEAMADILNSKIKSQKSKPQIKIQKLRIKSLEINSLFVNFLSKILAMSQINKKIYLIKKIRIGENKISLEAELLQYPVVRFDEDIKAVTYEYLDIKKTRGKWQTDLVFDI